MELRTLLYGYNKHQFRFLINETESAVVRGIFDEYISGGTLQKIADRLTAENTVYYKDKTVFDLQWAETREKTVQKMAKLLVFTGSIYSGEQSDQSGVFEIKK